MNKRRNSVIKILLLLSVAIVVINAFRAEYSPYVKHIAKMGTYVVSVEADAIIVRDETVVESGTRGIMEPSVKEGERVAAYSRIGALVTGNINEDKMAELDRINREIDALSQTISEAGLLTIDDSKVDTTLRLSLDNLNYAAAKNDVGTAVKLCENIRILTERKSGVTTSSTAQTELEGLMKKREDLAVSLGGSHKDLYAPKAGLYSGKLDGLENVLTFDHIKKITPDNIDTYFDKIGSTEPEGPCKIINNYKWCIVFNLENDELEGMAVGKVFPVSFKDLGEKELEGKVEYISEPDEEGRCAVTMYFNEYIDNFTSVRATRVEICKEKHSGIYVPRNAIRVQDVQGVWVQNEATLEFRSIVEVYRSDDFVLVKPNADGQGKYKNIALYDAVVLNPD